MSAAEWLDVIRGRGAAVFVDAAQRLVIEPDVLTDAEAEDLLAVKPELLALLQRRAPVTLVAELEHVLTRLCELAVAEADRQEIDDSEVARLHHERRRLTSEIGPAFGEGLQREVLHAFRFITARCGRCGGLCHDGPCVVRP